MKVRIMRLCELLLMSMVLVLAACTPYSDYGAYYPYESYYYGYQSPALYYYPYYSNPHGYYYYPRHRELEEREGHEGFEHRAPARQFEGRGGLPHGGPPHEGPARGERH
jgi:hypothetical protein